VRKETITRYLKRCGLSTEYAEDIRIRMSGVTCKAAMGPKHDKFLAVVTEVIGETPSGQSEPPPPEPKAEKPAETPKPKPKASKAPKNASAKWVVDKKLEHGKIIQISDTPSRRYLMVENETPSMIGTVSFFSVDKAERAAPVHVRALPLDVLQAFSDPNIEVRTKGICLEEITSAIKELHSHLGACVNTVGQLAEKL